MHLAIIPARGGSKRIPEKNIRDFCGQPIINYSIKSALSAAVFDHVIVSTDCDLIADVAIAAGAEVPFKRPAELSDDHTPTVPVIRHAIEAFDSPQDPVTYACCIYATAPLIDPADIRMALGKLQQDSAAEFAFPISTFSFPIMRSLKLNGDRIEMNYPEHELTRSQDLPEAWHDAGQFYWGTAEAWKSASGIYSSASIGIPIPRHRVQDIDTLEDWARAEAMYRSTR